jgi:hypothetical protein
MQRFYKFKKEVSAETICRNLVVTINTLCGIEIEELKGTWATDNLGKEKMGLRKAVSMSNLTHFKGFFNYCAEFFLS